MVCDNSFHENYSHQSPPDGSSNRTFGVVFAAFFLIIALLPLLHGHTMRLWVLPLAAYFLIAALAIPGALAPLNRLWTKFGLLLHNIVSPVVLGILFFGVFTPTALVMRLLGNDPLRLGFDKNARSYWILRIPSGTTPESLKNQF